MAPTSIIDRKAPGAFGCAASWALDHILYGWSNCYPDGEPLMSLKALREREWVACNCDHDDCRGYCLQPRGQGCRCPSYYPEPSQGSVPGSPGGNPPPNSKGGSKPRHKQARPVSPEVGRLTF